MSFSFKPDCEPVWRTVHSIQFGVDTPQLILEEISNVGEHMIHALRKGATFETLHLLAKELKADPSEVSQLLAQLDPVLSTGQASASNPKPATHILIDTKNTLTAHHISFLLEQQGYSITHCQEETSEPPKELLPSLVIMISSFRINPRRYMLWLRRDIPYLPITLSDRYINLGPLVIPGKTPCQRCIDLYLNEQDPTWAAVSAQLSARESKLKTSSAYAAFSSVATHVINSYIEQGHSEQYWSHHSGHFDTHTGIWSYKEWSLHERCGCAGLTQYQSV